MSIHIRDLANDGNNVKRVFLNDKVSLRSIFNSVGHDANSVTHSANSVIHSANSMGHSANSVGHSANSVTHDANSVAHSDALPIKEITTGGIGVVSVIIPTYNRLKSLLVAIDSVRNQTYKDIEIIVVNDGSSDKEYYMHDFGTDVKIVHLKKNTREIFTYPCVGHVINVGLLNATGKYVAFLDDDDMWFPKKLELQLKAMQETGCKMCATDGLAGKGAYDKDLKYLRYNAEHFRKILESIYKKAGYPYLITNGFPKIWNLKFIRIHNCIIASSVLLDRDIINKIGTQREIKMGGCKVNGQTVYIDYDYWLRALEHTDCVYVEDLCFYYDLGHAGGNLY